MELKIYDKANNLRLTASPNSSSSVTEEIGGECSVSASFTHTEYVPLDVDDYIELEGVRYKVKSRYRPKQKNTQTYEYSVKFYAPIHDAEDTLMLFQEGGTTSEFSYDGGPREHLQLWIDNMNRRAGGNLWSIGTVITAENKVIDYRNVKCWDAAFGSNGIAATFGTEMWADGYVINLCKAERGEVVELGYLQGLTNLAQEDNGEVKFFTRLFPLGSTRNIDATKYGYSRLQLPSREIYVDKNVDLYGVKEETEEAAFAEIYPQYVGTVSSVRTEEKTSEEGRKYTVYYFKDNGMNWNPKDYEIPDLDYMLQFQTGELAGRGTDGSFQAAWHEDTREWEIINVYPDDTTQIPGDVIIPNPGDKYIPWNFAMPQEYITAAEQAYKQAVDDYLNTYSFDPNKYTGTTDRNYIEKNNTPLRIGWNVRLLSEQYFGSTGGYKDTRITKVQRKLNDLFQATITCSDEVGTGWKSSVDNSLNSLRYEVARQAEEKQIDVLKTSDTKTPSDYNVFSSLRSRAEFVSKKFNDTVIGVLTFLQTQLFREGAVFGKDGFAEGLTGFGAKIDKKGYGEMRGLRLWEFLEVPELRYNRVEIFLGIKWRVPGAGIILSCTPDTDSEGNQLTTGTCTLKLEEGEFGAVSKDDIALGIFHFGDERDATEDSDDSKGNFKFSGFATTYFRVTEVSGDNNETFRYALRPGYTIHPQPQMNFSCYGNFTDEARQSSAYETRTYTRLLWKQNDWEFTVGNIAMQYGDLTNLNIFGLNMSGYSMYLNSVYFTGTINQVRPDGTPVLVANDRGQWESGTKYEFYDRVSHDGILWLCVAEDGTDTEPSKENADWLLQVDKGEDGAGLTYIGRWNSKLVVPKMGSVTMNGSTFAAKVATTNPPLWCWTDNQGNRFIFSDGGYVMTGEENTSEYDMIASKGEDGTNAAYNEEIYTRTTTYSIPSTPTSPQRDEYVPSGWTRTQSGISSSYPYEWVSKRRKSSDGVWGLFSTPVVCAQLGEKGVDGLQGCAIRDSEWALNTEYRNDSDVTDGSLPVRYIDVVLVRNNAVETGWDAYQCLKTHVSSSSITYANTQYWKKFGANVGSIFTSLIIAKNAKIQLFQGNDLLIQKDDGTVTAGMTGSNQGSLVRIFAGSTYENRASAPFRVTESGELYATKAHIQGEVVATSGTFSGELKGATGTFTGSLIAGDPTGERIIIDSGAKSIGLISGNLLLSYWEFFDNMGFKSCKLTLMDNDYENATIYPHQISISRLDLFAKLTPSSLTISSGSISTSIGSNRIYMSDGSNSYIGYTGTAEYVPPNGYSKTLYFKNGILYKIG